MNHPSRFTTRELDVAASAVANSSVKTLGGYADEDDAKRDFDARIKAMGCFGSVYEEVRGYYLQPRLGQDRKDPRIDRIVMPGPALIDAGWIHGPFGVECKASDKKVGPVIAQAQDYARAVFTVGAGYKMLLDLVFIWPMDRLTGPAESCMCQNRIGHARPDRHSKGIVFCFGGTCVIRLTNGQLEIKPVTSGRKAGSR